MNTIMSEVPLREHIEAIMTEREKALTIASTALKERLNYERADHEKAIERLNEVINKLSARQSWMIGVGATLVVLAGVLGEVMGRLIK